MLMRQLNAEALTKFVSNVVTKIVHKEIQSRKSASRTRDERVTKCHKKRSHKQRKTLYFISLWGKIRDTTRSGLKTFKYLFQLR